MNRILISVAALSVMHAAAVSAEPVETQREWTERFELTTDNPVFEISNIWGNVEIMAGAEGEITMNIREHRSAPTQALFDRSQTVYGLELDADGGGVAVTVGENGQRWHGSDPCRRCRAEYQFEVYVPANTRVYASTVNDGEVMISGIVGRVSADNVNGPVTVLGATACNSLQSVNGDVNVSFSEAPGSDCDIETVNGDIHLAVPGKAGLDVSMDLFNGRVSSELPIDPLAIPARVEHTQSGSSNQYRIEQAAGIRLAGGGPVFSVSSINGDLRIQKSN